MSDSRVLIAGAGIAGLATALALDRIGVPSLVLEQAHSIETVGAGLQIGPNAAKALRWLGAWDHLATRCVAPEAIEIRDALTGAVLQVVPLNSSFESRFGAPYRVAHRADLLASLLAASRERRGIEIQTGLRVTGYRNEAETVTILLHDGSTRSADRLIGADGIHSAIRRCMLEDGPPIYRGQALYRALLARARVPARLAGNKVALWLGTGFHAVQYPVSGGADLNLLVSVDSPWTSESWNEPADARELAHIVASATRDLADVLALPQRWLKWAAADRAPSPRWHDGRAIIVGDAAHATLPYLAQGAAMALEDAVVLSRHWEAPAGFAHNRLPRVTHVQDSSRTMARIYHAKSLTRFARNLAIRSASPAKFLNRLAWLYGYDPVTG
jgi:salicylate hydroxylase